jgi:hypothetical protein
MKNIDIRDLKSRAIRWPEPVKTLILTEPDALPADEFLSLISTCEKLLILKREA